MIQQPRVTTGTLKGLKLKVPKRSRPFTERVKRVMFDTILGYLKDTKCLDLFAGSGSIGIEAISRGASYCVFVENDREAINVIKENIEKANIKDQTRVYGSDYRKFLNSSSSEKFDIIFVDPPFEMIWDINMHGVENLVNDDGLVIFKSETNKSFHFPKQFEEILVKKVGSNTLHFLKLKPEAN